MKIQREFVDGNGVAFDVVIELAESGPALERAVRVLANRARWSASKAGRDHGSAKACHGVVRVTVRKRGGQ